MPKTSFSNEERTAAKSGRTVLFQFAVDGGGAADFPYQDFSRGGPLTPSQAEDLIEVVQSKLKSFRQEAA